MGLEYSKFLLLTEICPGELVTYRGYFCWILVCLFELTFQTLIKVERRNHCIFWVSCRNYGLHVVFFDPSSDKAVRQVGLHSSWLRYCVQGFYPCNVLIREVLFQEKNPLIKWHLLDLFILFFSCQH